MTNPLLRKLTHFVRLAASETRALEDALGTRVRHYERRTDIVREGDPPQAVRVVLAGWMARYKQLPNGQRQIVAFMLAGDVCDRDVFLLRAMDHTLGALTPVTLAQVEPAQFDALVRTHQRLQRALSWETLVHAAITREWVLNLGQRDAMQRLAHLLCELHHRLRAVGLTQGTTYELPLTQEELAQATGMTAVHVNRSLQELRQRGSVTLQRRMLTITDLPALTHAALFTPDYLHLDREGRAFDAPEPRALRPHAAT